MLSVSALLAGACALAQTPALSTGIPATPTQTPIVQPADTVMPTIPPAYTPIPTVAPSSDVPPATIPPTFVCETHTASVIVSADVASPGVGDRVKITVTLKDEGCTSLGMPRYRLEIQSEGAEAVFTPDSPEPITHYLAVEPGQSDTAEFELQAAAAGQATLTVLVSFEVHIGYPGPAYWGGGASEPLVITVAP